MNSRRDFLKNSALLAAVFGGASLLGQAENLTQNSAQNLAPQNLPKSLNYFIQDLSLNAEISGVKADKILKINGDIAQIYSELKAAFQNRAIIGSVSGETAFFVLSQMARDYGFRVIFSEKMENNRAWILAPKGVKR